MEEANSNAQIGEIRVANISKNSSPATNSIDLNASLGLGLALMEKSKPSKLSTSTNCQTQLEKMDLIKSKLAIDHVKKKNELEIELLGIELEKERSLMKMMLDSKKEEFELYKKYKEQQAQLDFNVSVALARKKLRDAMICQVDLDHLIPSVSSLSAFPTEKMQDYFLQVGSDYMPMKTFLQFLSVDYPPLFYSSPDLILAISPFNDQVSLDSLETAFQGKTIHEFLTPFRLALRDKKRVWRELKSRMTAADKLDSSLQDFTHSIQKTIIEKGYLDIAEAVEKAKIDLSDEDELADEIVEWSRQNDLLRVQCCIALGLDIDSKNIQSGSALHWAAFNGNIEIVSCLLDAGANLNALSNNQSTPLFTASMKGHFDIVKKLVERGANLDFLTKDGKSAYLIALEKGHNEICTFLEKSAKLNEK